MRLLPAPLATAPALLAPALLAAAPSVQAETCDPARVMVVLDKSSSMQTGLVANRTKWSIAVDGLGQVLNTYDARAEFGLMTFPRTNQCAPGGLDIAPAMHNRDAILGALNSPPPDAGNWTPMAQTLQVAANEPSLVTAPGTRHVILITDGWQWCSPYDPATRYDGVEAVEALNAQGVTTWVVGFGGEVDAAALNKMAQAANTAKPGCDPTLSDPAAPNQCYFQVDSAAELVAALTAIAGNISDEICDGIDNDCDGQIDEDLVRACSNSCGTGTETCEAGGWGACTAAPSSETCDGEDNDCDGVVDNNDVCGVENPETDEGGAVQAGCACDAGRADAGGFLIFALGALVARRRRR